MENELETQNLQEEKKSSGAILVVVGFVVFILAFLSLGTGESFREERLASAVGLGWKGDLGEMTSEKFIELYMPYFEYFARK